MNIRRLLLVCSLLLAPCSLLRAADPLSPDISVSITSISSLTGQALNIIDLSAIRNPQMVSLELVVTTNSTAPGSSRTLTVYYALSGGGSYTAAQMATAASSSVISVVNTASNTQVYTIPIVYVGARYFYVWFDHSARDSGSTLAITERINGLIR